MKIFKGCLFGLLLLASTISATAQTIRQFNGLYNITLVKSINGQFEISGTFSDLNNVFTASNVMVGDQIVDPGGNTYAIITITSVSGSNISVEAKGFNSSYPSMGQGIIYRPTTSGYPLIANSTPSSVLNTVLNTSTISINSDLPKFQYGISLPSLSASSGDVVLYSITNSFYKLSGSTWQQLSVTPMTSFATSIASVSVNTAGSIVYLLRINKNYISDGISWKEIPLLSSLPSVPQFGDVFFVTGEKKLYMMTAAEATGTAEWLPISSSSIPGGGTVDLPTSPKPGDLFFNTDENKLYVFENNNTWVEVSINGSTPGGVLNPDPVSTQINNGSLFYNTTEKQLYVYNGSTWMPVGNALSSGQIYVGNLSNVAAAVTMSGDATITNSGKLTVNSKAISDEKLDKGNIPLSGFASPTDNVTLGDGTTNYKIVNLANPSAAQDAVTKSYVDVLFMNPASLLTLPSGNLFVGNASNKAVATLKSAIPLSGFGNPTTNISMNGKLITNLASPSNDADAVNKIYVDTRPVYPINISLYRNMLLLGNDQGQAGMVEKKDIPLSDLGSATSNVLLGGFKIENLAEPTLASDASTKNYVDSKVIDPSNISLSPENLFVGNSSGRASSTIKNSIPISGFGAATADISLGNFKINNLASPIADSDASTKKYVDDLLLNPVNTLSLPAGNFFVGNTFGKASPTIKNAIPISGFGKATETIFMGDISTQYNISNLAEPLNPKDAATKNYVDIKVSNPSSIVLPADHFLYGSASNMAEAVAKGNLSLSGFGAFIENLSLSNYKITNLADPTDDLDAVNKKYVSTQLAGVNNLLTLPSGQMLVGNTSGKAAATAKNSIPLSGFGIAEADIALGNHKITGLLDPTTDLDAANKKYVDAQVAGVNAVLTLDKGNMLVGDATGKAASVAKSAITLSGFGDAEANVSMGSGSNNYKIINVANPTGDQDAATKKYVDGKTGSVPTGTTPPANPVAGSTYYNTTEKTFYVYDGTKWVPVDNVLPSGQLYVGDATGKAIATNKTAIPLSGFGDAAATVSLGNNKISNLADPTADQEAATKKYVDGKTGSVPTGTTPPANPVAGSTYYNTTEKTFYVYDGTKWVPVDNVLPSGQLYVGDATGKAVATVKTAIPLSGFGDAAATVSLGNNKISNLADPTADQEAATKKYVDGKTGSVPTGTTPPANPVAGSTYYNTTEKTFYVYDGTKWVPVDNVLPSGQLYVGDATGKAVATAKIAIPLSGFGDAAATVSLGNNKISNLADPTADQEAATKKYVDGKTGSVPTGTTPPANPVAGSTYYNTTEKTFYVYDGTKWVPVDNVLPSGQLYVGDATGKAVATNKTAIPLSGFGDAAATVSLGNNKISNLADPTADQEAATKKYVDGKTGSVPTGTTPPANPVAGSTYYNTTEKIFYVYDGTKWVPVDNVLPSGQLYVGDATGKAVATAKSVISLSGFGDAEANISMGSGSNNYKLINLADPTGDQEAATKKYVDGKVDAVKLAPIIPGSILGNNTAATAAPLALTPADVKLMLGLNNVENTKDADKNVLTATKLATPVNINGTPFDGSSNITINGDNLGNHTATQNIKTISYSISRDGQDGQGLSFEASGNANFAQDVTVKGNFYTPSDMRLKTNIETLGSVLQAIDQMRGVKFEYKDQRKYAKGAKIGVIAQELQKIYPEMVSTGSDGYLKVDYTQLTGVLIQAVKEQQEQMKQQQNEINMLKANLEKQQEQINLILNKIK